MKFTTTALVALSARVAFSATIALAARAADVALDKRATQGAYLCTDRDFKGHCVDIKSEASACVPLGADLNDKVSSVGPDKGSLCYFFVDPNCSTSGDFFHINAPGVADLSKTPVNGPAGSTRNFEDKLSSYFCVPE